MHLPLLLGKTLVGGKLYQVTGAARHRRLHREWRSDGHLGAPGRGRVTAGTPTQSIAASIERMARLSS